MGGYSGRIAGRAAARALARAAQRSGLRMVTVDELCLTRHRAGRGFCYRDQNGDRITDGAVLARLRGLAVPPAYSSVRFAATPEAHLQAIGVDEAGRTQYRYHPDWEAIRESRKSRRLKALLEALPGLRRRVREDLSARRASRAKAAACAVAMIEKSHIRIGGEAYLQTGGSRGAATLLKRQAKLGKDHVDIRFRGKGKKEIETGVDDPLVAKALKQLSALPGSRLLSYRDGEGKVHALSSRDINNYLATVTDGAVSAKDLRTLGGSTAAAEAFLRVAPGKSVAKRRRQIAHVMSEVSSKLGNTPAVARKSYVAQAIVDAFEKGTLKRVYRNARPARDLRRVESMLRRLFRAAP